jgi:hypothetical protein
MPFWLGKAFILTIHHSAASVNTRWASRELKTQQSTKKQFD